MASAKFRFRRIVQIPQGISFDKRFSIAVVIRYGASPHGNLPRPENMPPACFLNGLSIPVRTEMKKSLLQKQEALFHGDPYGNRTHVTAVKGRCLNRLTNGPGSGNLIRTDDIPGMNRLLYQLSYAAMWSSQLRHRRNQLHQYTPESAICQGFFSIFLFSFWAHWF